MDRIKKKIYVNIMSNKFLDENKEIIISLITGIFIYYRKLDYYKTIPRESIFTSILIMIWTYLSIQNPWIIIFGLVMLNLFGYKHNM